MAAPKVYNGSSWVLSAFKQWRSVWEARPYFYDGTEWVSLFDKVPEVVTLSGQTNTANAFGSTARSEIEFRTNGNVYEEDNNGTSNQVDSTTDWLRPTGNETDYQIRFTHVGATNSQFGATAAEGVWWPFSSGSFFIWISTTGTGFQSESETVTIEIRKGTGAVLDSGTYTVNANREDF